MKFGLSQLFNRTPRLMAKIGHAMIAASVCVTMTDFSGFPKLKMGLQLGMMGGYFLVNLFGDESINK